MSLPRFYGQGNPAMEAAFADFVRFSAKNREVLDAFEHETGARLPTSPLNVMIDEATGHNGVLAEEFIEWLIVTYWGEADEDKTADSKHPD